jgi:hypothetical protein
MSEENAEIVLHTQSGMGGIGLEPADLLLVGRRSPN